MRPAAVRVRAILTCGFVAPFWTALLISRAPAAEPSPVTEADGRRVALAFQDAIASGEPAQAALLVDWDAIVGRATAGFPKSAELEELREEFAGKFLESIRSSGGLTSQVSEAVQHGGSYSLLRMRAAGQGPVALMRFVIPDGGGVNYHELEFGRGADGRVRIVDFYIMTAGERFSTSLRRTLIPQVAALSGAGSLPETDRRILDQAELLASAGEHLEAGDAVAALAEIESLPDGAKLDRPLQFVRLAAAEMIGAEEYAAAVAELRNQDVTDLSLELVTIDGFARLGDFDAALESIDRLDREIGGDPYLHVLRAGILYQAARLDEAAAAARKAIAEDPTLEDAYWQLTTISLDQSDFDVTSEMLTELEQRLKVGIADLTAIPQYAEFVKSPQYAKWMRSRRK